MTFAAEGGALSPPAHLSPSSIGTWQQCPLKFKYSRLDKIPEPATEAQLLGTITHEILEHLYQLPAAERTQTTARRLAASLWDTKWEQEAGVLGLNPNELHRFRWQIWWCVEALFKMEDPQQVHPTGIEDMMRVNVEGVTLLGIIDRWEELADGSVRISDYKTGKKPRPQYEGEKKFQLAVYKVLVESGLSKPVAETELLYLKEGIRWAFIPTDRDVANVKQVLADTWGGIVGACETGIFEAKTSTLCGWCSYKSICPAWRR